jgi:DNA-binding MarR family transcriptional regulator
VDKEIIFRYFAHILKAYHRRLVACLGDEVIGNGQLAILRILNHKGDGKTQDELSKILFLDKTTVTRTLQKLIKNGYVIKLKDKDDRRINRIYLTKKSKELAMKVNNLKADVLESLMQGITDEEFEGFFKVLTKMFENAERNTKNYE